MAIGARAQQIGPIAQGDNPKVEYKLVRNSSGCYEVYFRTSMAFNSQLIQSAQVTIVAPKGTITQSTVPNANVIGNGITFAATNSGDKYEVQTPGGALATTNDYLIFGINPFSVTTAANTDYLLFSFCLVNNACPGDLRLIDGVSPLSPFYSADNGCTSCTYYSGPVDPAQSSSFDPYNSMSIDNNVQSGSGIYPNTIEGYQDNYGSAVVACEVSVPDLEVAFNPTTATGTTGTSQTYSVIVSNTGTAPTSGSASVSVSVPAGITVSSVGGNGWACTPSAPVTGAISLTCTNPSPSIGMSSTSTFPMVVQSGQDGTYTFNAAVSGGGETNTTNNTAMATYQASTNCAISAGVLNVVN